MTSLYRFWWTRKMVIYIPLVILWLSFVWIKVDAQRDSLPACQRDEMNYAFTECDTRHNTRWRVAVPRNPEGCSVSKHSSPSFTEPLRVDSCYTSCDAGEFFNVSSMGCEKCSAGTFSLGGGIKITSFKESDLKTNNMHIITKSSDGARDCPAWKSKESFLQITSSSIPTGGCTSIVSLRTRIVKKGRLRFTYQYILPDDFANSVLFSFHHKNYDYDSLDSIYAEDSQASSTDDGVDDVEGGEWESSSLFEGDSYHINFPKATRNGKWNVFELQLPRPGYYSFFWRGITIGNIHPSTFMLEKRSFKVTDAYPSSLLDLQKHEEKSPVLKRESDDSSISSFQDDSIDSRVGAISIKLIQLDGIAYASECTSCPSGFYSLTDGSSECIPCPTDTFSSSKGSTSCRRCDEATEYAPKGSTSCHSKPVCSSVDYYEEKIPCDSTTNTQVVKYKWVEPKICREEPSTVSVLPPDKTMSCDFSKPDPSVTQVCSPGMELNPKTGKCSFCRENEFNDGKSASCFKCPPNSLPKYSLILNTWRHEIDDDTKDLFLSRQCVLPLKDSMECDPTVIPWQMIPATTSYFRSATNAELDALLILTMSTPGFRHSSGGVFSASFELVGSDSNLVLYESLEMSFNPETMKRIGAWSGDTDAGVRKFRLTIPSNRSVSFIWLFKRDRNLSSHLKIYSSELTNSLVGGAISCSLCQPNELQSQGNDDSSCIPCPSGLYLSNGDEDDNDNDTTAIDSSMVTHLHTSQMNSRCLKCPPKTVINGTLRFPRGRNASCLTCGPGLASNDERTQCVPQCKLHIGEDIFDLDFLPRPLLFRGRSLFTSQGTPHYHVFNITVCGEGVFCSNNATMEVALSSFRPHHREPKTMACRSTIIPDGGKLYATQSISLGDELIAITKETSFQGIHVHPEFSGVKSDLHFFFRSPSTTAACHEGRTLTLTLRCSLDSKEPVLSSPSNCSDVTCDGCNFHLLLRSNSSAACRKCQRGEYEELVGECVSGSQVIHAINPKNCILTPSLTKRSKPCSIVPKSIQYLIMMLCLIGFGMSYSVIYFWRQNRKLVYKYSKLIEDKNPAECCIDDDEDGQRNDNDDDEPENKECPNGASSSRPANIRQQRRQERVKFRNSKHEAVDFGYETIQLTKACEDDIL